MKTIERSVLQNEVCCEIMAVEALKDKKKWKEGRHSLWKAAHSVAKAIVSKSQASINEAYQEPRRRRWISEKLMDSRFIAQVISVLKETEQAPNSKMYSTVHGPWTVCKGYWKTHYNLCMSWRDCQMSNALMGHLFLKVPKYRFWTFGNVLFCNTFMSASQL